MEIKYYLNQLNLTKNSIVFIVLGEINLRCHFARYYLKKRDTESEVQNQALEDFWYQYQSKSKSIYSSTMALVKLVVPAPPFKMNNILLSTMGEYAPSCNDKERLALYRTTWNILEKLNILGIKESLPEFIRLTDKYKLDNGFMDSCYSRDAVHLADTKGVQVAVQHLLNDVNCKS